jgi:tRNA(fMet)-specific endonuclease VapC
MTFRSTERMFCLDTNVVIFAMNERKPKIVERLHRELAARTLMIVPAIVMFELEYGCAKSARHEHSRRALEIFLSAGFDQPPFDIEDAREAGEIRAVLEASGQPIGPYDTLIAGPGAPTPRNARDVECAGVRARAGTKGRRLGGVSHAAVSPCPTFVEKIVDQLRRRGVEARRLFEIG